jgi:hypothetical protein
VAACEVVGVGGQGAHWFSAFAVLEVVVVVWARYGGQGTHELADPLHALGVEPVDRLVEEERPGVV